uniref:N-6 adenine-specific DNA methyltransferase 1 n=1 Tax=Sander lucioperca TaxID=283035 RepID=A0A8C9YSN2_SANLU
MGITCRHVLFSYQTRYPPARAPGSPFRRGHLREVYERAEDSFLLVDISGWTFSSIAPCNNVSLQPVNTSLGNAECLLPRLSGKVDVLLFNPPYVVTPSEEVHGYRGCLGRGGEVTDTFLSVVAQLLSSKGLFYLITIADNDPEEIIRLLDVWFEGRVMLGNERLFVLRFHGTSSLYEHLLPRI